MYIHVCMYVYMYVCMYVHAVCSFSSRSKIQQRILRTDDDGLATNISSKTAEKKNQAVVIDKSHHHITDTTTALSST